MEAAQPKQLESVQEHAKKLQADLIAQGKMQPEPGEPIFTAPVEQPKPFTETTVEIPPGTETQGAPKVSVEQTPVTAAVAAAEAVADAFGEYEEFEVEDADLEAKIPVRVPKKFATAVKRGYPRRADYDRMMTRYREADPVLQEFIERGQIRDLLPLIRAARENQAFGEYVTKGYQRLQQGLPLVEQAAREAAAMAAPATPASPVVDDPVFGELLNPLVQRIDSRFGEINQKFQTFEQQQEAAKRQAEETQRRNQEIVQTLIAAHQDLERTFPGKFRTSAGPQDPNWVAVNNFARDGGYVDTYGLRGGLVAAAYAWNDIEAQRLAATGSPAAEVLASIDNRQVELARKEAAQTAAVVGSGAAPAPAPAPVAAKPSTRNPDGSMKPPEQYLREVQAAITR